MWWALLTPGFRNRPGPGDFALGGATWSVVKCDESHNLVVVVPGGNGNGTSRVFWTAGEEAALSPVICAAVQRILPGAGPTSAGGKRDSDPFCRLGTLPAGTWARHLCPGGAGHGTGREVVVTRFTQPVPTGVAHLSGPAGGGVWVRYDDYRVRVTGWKMVRGEASVIERISGNPPDGRDCAASSRCCPLSPGSFRRSAPAVGVSRHGLRTDYYYIGMLTRSVRCRHLRAGYRAWAWQRQIPGSERFRLGR